MKTYLYFGLIALFLGFSFRFPPDVLPAEAQGDQAATSLMNVEKGRDTVIAALDALFPATVKESADSAAPETAEGYFDIVENAIMQNDPHVCGTFPESTNDDGTIPSQGDWIAYCLGRLTNNERRCLQITPGTSPNLRATCDEEI